MAQWLVQRRKTIGLLLLIAIAALSVLFGVRSYRERQEQDAAAMLAVALRTYNSPVVAEGEAGSIAVAADEHGAAGHTHYTSDHAKFDGVVLALQPIIEQYGGFPSGRAAAFYLGNSLARLGRADEAIEALTRAADAASPLLRAMATYRLGELHIAQERYSEAIVILEPLVSRPPVGFPVEEALFAKGRAHEGAGDQRAAMLVYQRISEEHPTSIYSASARTRAEELAATLGISLDTEG